MAKSHKTCMKQAEIIDTFGTYQGTPHRGYPTHRGPSYGSSERSPPVYSPKGKGVMGLSPLSLRVGVRTVDTTQLYHGCRSDCATMLNWTSFRAFKRDHNAEGP